MDESDAPLCPTCRLVLETEEADDGPYLECPACGVIALVA